MLRNFTYDFQRCDKVGIVGRNGVGKTTFLDLLTGAVAPDSGFIDRGETLRIGYYRQQGMEFRPGDTVLDIVPDTRLLGHFLFPRDMWSTRVERLSGGEKRRLYLLTILLQEPNLLILDEPTNDLDIVTLNILEEYLLEFKGTLILVSHDRHFLDRLADHLFVFCGDGVVKDFIGDYSEYRAYLKEYEAAQKARAAEATPRAARVKNVSPDKPRKLSWKESRELEALEERIPTLEAEKAALEANLSGGTLSPEEILAASTRYAALQSELDAAETRWLELQV
jgi:ATP-binding cassette subfamily F protein uup